MEPVYSDHSRLEERSLVMHRLIARKLLTDPTLLRKATDNLRRWRRTQGSPSQTLAEWERILGGSVDQVESF